MKRRLFYSWQSDLPAALNRNLIQDALERAGRDVSRDESEWIQPVIDRDTSGVDGTPNIADTIFTKIASSDAFIADVTIVNSGGTRLTPNPNVLIELGYAVGKLGWGRVLLIQNTAYGAPDDLPFDLRGRRCITYHAPEGSDRAQVRTVLQQRVSVAIRTIVGGNGVGTLPTGLDASIWLGTWSMGEAHDGHGGTLIVKDVCSSGYSFDISVIHGAHSGQVSGFAQLVSADAAYARIHEGNFNGDGEISFNRSSSGGRRVVRTEETESCMNFHGMRAHFGGEFTLERLPWLDAGLMNEIEIGRVKRLLGSYFNTLRSSTRDISSEVVGEYGVAKAMSGGMPGLYTAVESIVVLGHDEEVWCAYLDGDEVMYFTTITDLQAPMPQVIENWRARFAERAIVRPPPDITTFGDRALILGQLPPENPISDA